MKTILRNLTTVSEALTAKSYRELPTLPSLPLIGHTYLFLPGGRYTTERISEAVEDLKNRLGPVYRLTLGGSDIVFTTDADHAEILFRNEGKLPFRPPFSALAHYRKRTFNSIGVVPGNGEEWYRFRSYVLPLLKKTVVRAYCKKHEEVAKSFVDYVNNNRTKEDVIEDIHSLILKFTLESISVTSPGQRLKCLSGKTGDTTKIIRATIDFMDGLHKTLLGPPIWKVFRTPGYRKLESSHEIVYSVIENVLKEHKNQYQVQPDVLMEENPFIFSLLDNKNISWNDAAMAAIEIFLGGIDATATTITLILHHLSQNMDIQDKAREEALRSQPEYEFLKACIKESLRVSPVAGAHSRCLPKDTVMGGYHIPAGTLVSVFSSVISTDSKYFEDAKSYIPQRWLRNQKRNIHPFAALPFGYGPRMCPGKRLAEQEIVILLKCILRKFKVIPTSKQEVGMVFRMNRIPDRKIDLKFVNIS